MPAIQGRSYERALKHHTARCDLCTLREAIRGESGSVMELFRKGEGGLGPIHNFEAHFCASFMEMLRKIKGYECRGKTGKSLI